MKIVAAGRPNCPGRRSAENGQEESHDKRKLALRAVVIGNIGECLFAVLGLD